MIVVVLLVLVVAVAAGAGLLAVGSVGQDHGGRRWGAVGALAVIALVGIAVAVAVLGLVGREGGGDLEGSGAVSETRILRRVPATSKCTKCP